jgi:DNA polymerase-3 subunit beta
MILEIEKSALLRAVVIADSIIQGKSVNAVIDNCLFSVFKDYIIIQSTDNEISLKTEIEANSDSEGMFTCDGKKLAQILKEMPDGLINISIESNLMKVQSKTIKGSYKLVTTDGENFPEIEIQNFENLVELDQNVFKKMIKKVIYAASHDSIKPVFNGVYLVSPGAESLNLVASDSRRLSLISKEVANSSSLTNGAVIPLKTINEVFKLLDSGMFKFGLSETQCYFQIGTTTIISRLIDGNFPDYDKVIPKDYLDTVIVDTKKLITSLRRVMVFTKEPTFKVTMEFTSDKLIIASKTPEYGEASEELPIERQNSEELVIGINSQYIMDSLKEIESFALKINLTGQMSPVTLVPEDDENYVAVIMPIQLRSAE